MIRMIQSGSEPGGRIVIDLTEEMIVRPPQGGLQSFEGGRRDGDAPDAKQHPREDREVIA
ncbi:MAG: hypothetical protein Q7S96_01285 [bacterium]|nr:hypothetical protein [bacterium]